MSEKLELRGRQTGWTEGVIEKLVATVVANPNTRIILPGPPSAQKERIIREVNRRAALLPQGETAERALTSDAEEGGEDA